MTAFNLIKSLTKRGNVVLGAGCYAAAIGSKDNKQVIKIGNSMTDPWLDYYHGIIKTNQANPHVPKVKYFMCDEAHSFYICIMERLEEETNMNINKTLLVNLCKDYTSHMITYEEFVDAAQQYPVAIPCPDMLANLLDKIHEDTEVFDWGDRCNEGSSRRLDMHRGNFMFRDDMLIVTDPWSEADMSEVVDVSEWVERVSNKSYNKNYQLSDQLSW
jgi:hypothetical protein